MKGPDMLRELLQVGLTEEAALRMMDTAKTYGLVNFTHESELLGLKYSGGQYRLGDADFSNVKR